MRTVTHREMRNSSGEILRAVAAGESVQVTNNGQVAAVIVPPATDVLSQLEERGQLRRATGRMTDLASIDRTRASLSTTEMIRDVRGRC